jgi:hypothetical protein
MHARLEAPVFPAYKKHRSPRSLGLAPSGYKCLVLELLRQCDVAVFEDQLRAGGFWD